MVDFFMFVLLCVVLIVLHAGTGTIPNYIIVSLPSDNAMKGGLREKRKILVNNTIMPSFVQPAILIIL